MSSFARTNIDLYYIDMKYVRGLVLALRNSTVATTFQMALVTASFFQTFPGGGRACLRTPLAWLRSFGARLRTFGAHFRRSNPKYMATPLRRLNLLQVSADTRFTTTVTSLYRHNKYTNNLERKILFSPDWMLRYYFHQVG